MVIPSTYANKSPYIHITAHSTSGSSLIGHEGANSCTLRIIKGKLANAELPLGLPSAAFAIERIYRSIVGRILDRPMVGALSPDATLRLLHSLRLG
jgi:hypothetical protein